jgi:CheY-like chemotaxis protein
VRTILIVEDDLHLRAVIRLVLERADYEVIEAADGWAAIKTLDETIPDVAIIDIKMPLMNGLELVERMKLDVRSALVPVVLLTGNRDVATNGHHSIPVVLKPFEPDALLNALSEAWSKKAPRT